MYAITAVATETSNFRRGPRPLPAGCRNPCGLCKAGCFFWGVEGAVSTCCSSKTCLQSAIASSFSTTSPRLCAKVALASIPNRPA